jgi:hypothetical protein
MADGDQEPAGTDGAAGPGDAGRPGDAAGPQPSRGDKRLYLMLMTICIGLFVISWAVVDRYSQTAAIAVSAVALVIPPFAVIIANAASASDRRRP